jgi:hypothetical protein
MTIVIWYWSEYYCEKYTVLCSLNTLIATVAELEENGYSITRVSRL